MLLKGAPGKLEAIIWITTEVDVRVAKTTVEAKAMIYLARLSHHIGPQFCSIVINVIFNVLCLGTCALGYFVEIAAWFC